MITHRRVRSLVLVALVLGISGLLRADQEKGKPSIKIRVSPTVVFVPGRIVATAELSDGADDFQDFYCAKVEWSWDDGTTSESQDDCDPYEPGKSTIRRHFTNEHRYTLAGNFNVRFALKQGSKTVGASTMQVRVRDSDLAR